MKDISLGHTTDRDGSIVAGSVYDGDERPYNPDECSWCGHDRSDGKSGCVMCDNS